MKTFLALCAVLVAALVAAPEAHAQANTAGNHVYAAVGINDATGVVTTVATADTFVTVGTAAPLVAGETDGSGCITYTLASNKFTIAKHCGAGTLRLEACLNDVQGTNAKFFEGAWHRVRSATTTVAGPVVRGGTEATTAVRASRGCVVAYVAASYLDTYDFRYDAETGGNTITTRAATFSVTKIKNL